MPAPVPGFVTAGDAMRKALAKNGTLTERLIAYRDSLGNAESKALIADALDELTYAPWRESRLLEALREMKELFRFALLCTTPEIAKDGRAFIDKAERLIATVEARGRAT